MRFIIILYSTGGRLNFGKVDFSATVDMISPWFRTFALHSTNKKYITQDVFVPTNCEQLAVQGYTYGTTILTYHVCEAKVDLPVTRRSGDKLYKFGR
jgi:hypothetical protein